MQTNWENLRDGLEQALQGQVAGLVDGSIESLNGPIRNAANHLMVAVRRGPAGQPLVDEIKDTLAIEMQTQQLALKGAAGGALESILGVGLNLMFGAATSALSSVKR